MTERSLESDAKMIFASDVVVGTTKLRIANYGERNLAVNDVHGS